MEIASIKRDWFQQGYFVFWKSFIIILQSQGICKLCVLASPFQGCGWIFFHLLSGVMWEMLWWQDQVPQHHGQLSVPPVHSAISFREKLQESLAPGAVWHLKEGDFHVRTHSWVRSVWDRHEFTIYSCKVGSALVCLGCPSGWSGVCVTLLHSTVLWLQTAHNWAEQDAERLWNLQMPRGAFYLLFSASLWRWDTAYLMWIVCMHCWMFLCVTSVLWGAALAVNIWEQGRHPCRSSLCPLSVFHLLGIKVCLPFACLCVIKPTAVLCRSRTKPNLPQHWDRAGKASYQVSF